MRAHRARARPRGRFRLAVDRSFHARRGGHRRDRHGAVGRGRRRRRVVGQPVGTAGARPLDPCAEPAGRAGRRRRPLRAQSRRRRRSRRTRSRAATSSLDPALARADRADRCDAASCSQPKRSRSSQWMPVRLHHAAAEVGARVVLLGDAPIAPGTEGCVQLVLERPIAAAVGDRFVLRDTSGAAHDRRRPLPRPARAGAQAPHAGAAGAARRAMRCAMPRGGARGTARGRRSSSTSRRSRATARSRPTRPQRLLERSVRSRCSPANAAWRCRRDAAGALRRGCWRLWRVPRGQSRPAGHRAGAAAHAARAAPAGAGLRVVAADSRGIRRDRARRRLGATCLSHAVRLTRADEKLWAAKPAAARRRTSGSVRRACATSPACSGRARRRRAPPAEALGRMGRSTRSRTTISSCARRSPRWSRSSPTSRRGAEREFTAAQFRDRLDNGRKVAIQILEFFDRHGVTCAAAICAASTRTGWTCFGAWPVRRGRRIALQEENRPRWGVRTSNPGGAASRSLGGFELPLSSATFKESQ